MQLDSLNESQRLAATHMEGPLLVLAGPGSGKTRVVTHRIAHLIAQGIPARNIVALSFTNKAADEMRRRVTSLVGPQAVEMGTFHRFAARLLRTHARMVGLTSDYSILDTDDSGSVMKRAAKRLGLNLTHTPIDRLAGIISRAKNDLRTPETFEPRWGRPADEIAVRLWPVYQQMMLECNAVDFDDLLVHVARLIIENPELRSQLDARHRWILVDEYQDTNAAQYAILRGLSIDYPNLSVTGDPDQAIYGWRGASIRNILEFERDYPSASVVKLEHNYRSTANILATADRLIAHNTRRKPKRLLTDAADGAPVRIVLDASGHEEADRIADEIATSVTMTGRSPRDFAILFRTNALSRSLEVALRSRGVPYQLLRGVEFFKRREIRDVIAWLRLLRNPRDDEALLRVVNVPARGIGRQSLDLLSAWAADHSVPLLTACGRAKSVHGLSARAATSIGRFAALQATLSRIAASEPSVAALLEAVLEQTGYRAMLADDEDEEGDDRLANVEELITAARQADAAYAADPQGREEDESPLGSFLDTTALVADTDVWDPAADRVSLMTFHAAKGLEFPVVYLVAMEDGILPHQRSLDQPDQLEEERRLVFVGITRGMEQVQASCARMRDYRGTRRIGCPSLFLAELSGAGTEVTGAEAPSGNAFGGRRPTADDESQLPPDSWDDDQGWAAPMSDKRPAATRDDGLVIDLDDEASPPQRSRPPSRPPRTAPPLETAADLARRTTGRQQPTPMIRGGRVRHAEYGEGTVAGVSGSGARSVATVIFDGPAGTRRFIVSHGALELLEG
jgi:DNA helicase-2/ATP-dependent DNA helicase PcrA